ncbi:MAG TPA: hypothetical protein VMW27_16265 [Thermoanaerobaculia bacterium]|nr:hypothetical protein [Thermoanaerobaculia bacterium]
MSNPADPGFVPPAPEPPADFAQGTEGSEELRARLRDAGPEELPALLAEHAGHLGAPEARQALRNPYLTAEEVELLARQPRLVSFYEVRRDIALHPKTPEVLALRFVAGLFWRDLVAAGGDSRLRPTVRRAADLQLAARLPELAVGEKVTIARRAGAGLLAHLRQDPSPRVIAALLDNPRLTEGVLAPLVHSERTSPPVLALIAADRRWGARLELRSLLCKNRRTPVETVLRILPTLRKDDLRAIGSDSRLAEAVRRRARLLLGEI